LLILSCKITKKEGPQLSKEVILDIGLSSNMNHTEKLTFPNEWLGYWVGDLHIFNEQGLKQTLPMALENSITDVSGQYTWAIIYGADSIAGRRDYMLNEVDKSKGHYIVDEKNGILLDAFLIDNELISVFEVLGNSLTSTYKREGDNLIFEIMMFKSDHTSITGDTIIGMDTIPPVKSFKPVVRQKAVLKRKA
jgi:hypothetical protein